MRRTAIALLLLMLFLPPSAALAHGFGQRYDLPVPLWLYLYGAAGTVALSFLLISLFVGEKHTLHNGYPRYNLMRLRWFRGIFTAAPFLVAIRILSVGLFLLVILTGFFGSSYPSGNFAPTFVWIIWWVGLSFFTALVGNIWPLVNPWKIIFDWADALARRVGIEGGVNGTELYPARWGVYPALILYFIYVWIEVIFEGSPKPNNLATFVLIYSLITWGGMAVYGKEVWLRNGEVFSVFFSTIARFAPTEVRVTDGQVCEECSDECRREDDNCVNCYECFAWATPDERELNLRPWAVGLAQMERITMDRLLFVIFILSSVTFDGLVVTPIWGAILRVAGPIYAPFGDLGYYALETLGLLFLPALFLGIYFWFSLLIRALGGRHAQLTRVAVTFVYSLIPIALAYQIAHYFTLFVIQGQNIFLLISDPFGRGWNLFGTAKNQINVGIVDAGFVWYFQVAVIVLGHVVAVYLAHVIAMRLFGNQKRALNSQYPMLGLMVLYTMLSLWILSQPIVQENKAAQNATLTGASRTPGLTHDYPHL